VANVNSPYGFRQYRGRGTTPSFEQFALHGGGIDYNTAAIYYGDPVVRVGSGDGTIKQAVGNQGGSTVSLAGIFQGCKYLSTFTKKTEWANFWPGSGPVTQANQSTITAYIINDTNAQFVVQSDSTGVTMADLGANFDFNIGTGNAANGLSGAFLLHTGATTAALPFRLQELVTFPPGAPGTQAGAYNTAVVSFNNVEGINATATNT
jgi:hypothetical protein